MDVQCDICSKHFNFEFSDIKRQLVEKDGKRFVINYYECPECKINFVFLVEDKWSELLKDEYMRKVEKIREITDNKQTPSKTLVRRMLDEKSKLQREYKKLSFEFPKTFYQFSDLLKTGLSNNVTDTLKSGQEEIS